MTEGYFKIPFTSKRKRMTTVLNNVDNNTPTRKRMHIKGASEIVLAACDKYYDWKNN